MIRISICEIKALSSSDIANSRLYPGLWETVDKSLNIFSGFIERFYKKQPISMKVYI